MMIPYLLGHSDEESVRLIAQARLLAPITKRFFLEAGISPGMRVLDVGSGMGDVAFLASKLVGPQGELSAWTEQPRQLRRHRTGGAHGHKQMSASWSAIHRRCRSKGVRCGCWLVCPYVPA